MCVEGRPRSLASLFAQDPTVNVRQEKLLLSRVKQQPCVCPWGILPQFPRIRRRDPCESPEKPEHSPVSLWGQWASASQQVPGMNYSVQETIQSLGLISQEWRKFSPISKTDYLRELDFINKDNGGNEISWSKDLCCCKPCTSTYEGSAECRGSSERWLLLSRAGLRSKVQDRAQGHEWQVAF